MSNKKFNVSKFNEYFKIKNDYLIFNLLSWNVCKVNKKIYEILYENDLGKIFNLKDKKKKKLLTNGLIKENNYSEESFLKYKINNLKYKNDADITIVPTHLCNFNCKYCYQEKSSKSMTDKVAKNITKFIKKNLNRYRTLNLEWFGGEPLLEKDKVLAISKKTKNMCKNKNVAFISSMTTNGYLLNYKLARELIKCNILFFQVTIDGPAQIHNKMRPLKNGGKTFNVIWSNLYDIKKNIKNNHIKIALRINISKENREYVDDFLDKYKHDFGNDNRFKLFFQTVEDWGGEKVKKMSDSLVKNEYLEDIYYKMNKLNVERYEGFEESIIGNMCYAQKIHGFSIDPDGTIYKCAKCAFERDPIKNMGNIGSVNSNGDFNLDENKIENWLRNKDINYNKCHKCNLKPLCLIYDCPLSKIKNINICIKEKLDIKTNLRYYIKNLNKKNKYTKI